MMEASELLCFCRTWQESECSLSCRRSCMCFTEAAHPPQSRLSPSLKRLNKACLLGFRDWDRIQTTLRTTRCQAILFVGEIWQADLRVLGWPRTWRCCSCAGGSPEAFQTLNLLRPRMVRKASQNLIIPNSGYKATILDACCNPSSTPFQTHKRGKPPGAGFFQPALPSLHPPRVKSRMKQAAS